MLEFPLYAVISILSRSRYFGARLAFGCSLPPLPGWSKRSIAIVLSRDLPRQRSFTCVMTMMMIMWPTAISTATADGMGPRVPDVHDEACRSKRSVFEKIIYGRTGLRIRCWEFQDNKKPNDSHIDRVSIGAVGCVNRRRKCSTPVPTINSSWPSFLGWIACWESGPG